MVKLNFDTRLVIDTDWQDAIRDAVTPENETQRVALHYATVTGAIPIGLPADSKSWPRPGLTGYVRLPEADVMAEEIAALTETSNLGLRLPVGVIGIDIDTYQATVTFKDGHRRLAKLEERAGALPPTWSSSRRPYDPDARSGIYYYRVPERIIRAYLNKDGYPVFVNQVCDYVESVQFVHRYGVVAPSTVDGLTYAWRRPDGTTEAGLLPPNFSELPVLSDVWVRLLVRNLKGTKSIRTLKDSRTPGETYTSPDYTDDAQCADDWCAEHIPGWNDQPDAYLQNRIEQALIGFDTGTSRYNSMRDAIWHLLHTAIGNNQYPGHPGGSAAIDQLADTFLKSKPNAIGEAARAFANAVDRVSEQIESGQLKPLTNNGVRLNTGGTRNV